MSASDVANEANDTNDADGGIDLETYADVWVFVEVHDGDVMAVSWELLEEGKKLTAKTGEDLVALVIGEDLDDVAREALERGADRVLVADDPVFEPYRADPYGAQFRAMVEERKPSIVLIGGTHTGRDFAGRVAVPTHAGLTADVTEIDVDDNGLLQARRPAFGGDILATILCKEHRPQMATVRPGVFEPGEPDLDGDWAVADKAVTAVDVVVDESETISEVLERNVGDTADITEADRIVAVGAGIEGNLEPAIDLAEAIGAELAASRAAVDEGWVDGSRQVGQTGKTVRPELYVALGISGAIQHVEGMNKSGTVIAINTDPNAPIFEHADYGIVGDFADVCPRLAETLRERDLTEVMP
ncbi:electron transfer flavoprotein subunit alpha/FixB family protein [Natronosalvus halobius]|uniref:electron transfer flavoprotein subunit alpha/FixB family protein n=1 Tax=Natronosalvus halobius TaxID=2953746 RepID=UPI00209EDE58|nr:electron transfer flavoprotein subunit alpha/FixB family protein [Natronosalvus halobius]USZ72285.1 electron transfer flavoprotein subunit alpha/FixB family protein [Natronosalvus halobius]